MPRKATRRRKVGYKSPLFLGRPLSQPARRRGLMKVERALKRAAAREVRQQRGVARAANRIHRPLRLAISDREAAEILRSLRSANADAHTRVLDPPPPEEVESSAYPGGFGAVETPPFLTWTPSSGDSWAYSNGATGLFGVGHDGWVKDSEGWASAGVGIEVQPVKDGFLAISSNPGYSYAWDDYAFFAVAGSSGYLGLMVVGYDTAGFPTGTVLEQRVPLWENKSYLGSSGRHEEEGLTISLDASCWVKQQHRYGIWVECHLRAFSDRMLGGAGVTAAIKVLVRSIVWTLI
jgi:hypothetical protein